ncbi:MAG TPA: DoxX family protein [Gemmatimonadaceae bacterium]|nr:DoxX family protein [Gemmatimonadaceae bacterium]
MDRGRPARSVTWILSIVLAIVFLATGIAKLTGASTFYIQAATMRGFPSWIRVVVGLVEIGGAIALLIPRAAVFGAVTLAILMFPAAATQHMSGQNGFWVPVVVFILLYCVVWLRSPELIHTVAEYFERPHAVLRDGVIAGLIGATAVAVWFFIVDVVAGHPLFTPDTLGHALFSVTGPVAMHERGAFIAAYTVFHYAAFIVAGIVAASVVDMAGEEPSVVLLAVLIFVAFEIGFYAFVAILQHSTPLGALAWYQVLIGNIIAAVAMCWYLWRARPMLKEQFAHALDPEVPA